MIGDTRFEVTARLDEEGNAKIRVLGRCSYGEGDNKRDATEWLDVEDEGLLTRVGKAMAAAISEVRDELNRQTVKAAMKCGSVAVERGEI